jgi:hypothetical protein
MKYEQGMKGKVLITISLEETLGFIVEIIHQFKQVGKGKNWRKAG